MVLGDPLEHEGLRVALGELEGRVHAAAAPLEPPLVAHRARDRALEGEREVRRAEQHPVRVHLDLVLGAAVVEARLHLDLEAHVAAHDDDAADQAMAVQRHLGVVDRHEVLHLPDAVLGQEARDQDVRVGEVELLGGPRLVVGLSA